MVIKEIRGGMDQVDQVDPAVLVGLEVMLARPGLLDPQVQQVKLVCLDHQARQDSLEGLAQMELLVKLAALVPVDHPVMLDHVDLLDHLVQRDLKAKVDEMEVTGLRASKEAEDQQVNQVHLDHLVLQDHLDQRGLKVKLDQLEKLGHKVHRECQARRVNPVTLDDLDHPDLLVHLGHLDQPVLEVKMVTEELKATEEILVQLAAQAQVDQVALRVNEDLQDHQDHLVHQVHLALRENAVRLVPLGQ